MAKHQPSAVRRAQIFAAAMEVCADKGYHATRIEDIAARAGLSKGSIYHHFKSKQQLFLELVGSFMGEMKSLMVEELQEHDSAAVGIRHMVRRFLELFGEGGTLMRGMLDFYLLGLRDPAFREAFLGYYEELVDAGAEFILRGVSRGEFDPEVDPRRVAWLFFTSGDGLILIHLVLGQERLGLELMLELTDLFIAALRPGQKEAS